MVQKLENFKKVAFSIHINLEDIEEFIEKFGGTENILNHLDDVCTRPHQLAILDNAVDLVKEITLEHRTRSYQILVTGYLPNDFKINFND